MMKVITKLGTYDFKSLGIREKKTATIHFVRGDQFVCGTLTRPAEIQTSVGKLKFAFIEFYSSGRFKGGCLFDSSLINTSVGKFKFEWIHFYESGALKMGMPNKKDPQIITTPEGPLKFVNIDFHENGKLKAIVLTLGVEINGKKFSQGSSMKWNKSGKFLGKN